MPLLMTACVHDTSPCYIYKLYFASRAAPDTIQEKLRTKQTTPLYTIQETKKKEKKRIRNTTYQFTLYTNINLLIINYIFENHVHKYKLYTLNH